MVRRENARATSLISRLREQYPAVQLQLLDESTASGKLNSAISQANLIVAATSSQEALFKSADVRPGTRIILIGSYKPHMREVDDDLIRRSTRIVVDSKKACLQEAGELISAGVKEEDLEELGAVRGTERTGEDIVIFKSVSMYGDVCADHSGWSRSARCGDSEFSPG